MRALKEARVRKHMTMKKKIATQKLIGIDDSKEDEIKEIRDYEKRKRKENWS